jgi:hypothetical protein
MAMIDADQKPGIAPICLLCCKTLLTVTPLMNVSYCTIGLKGNIVRRNMWKITDIDQSGEKFTSVELMLLTISSFL